MAPARHLAVLDCPGWAGGVITEQTRLAPVVKAPSHPPLACSFAAIAVAIASCFLPPGADARISRTSARADRPPITVATTKHTPHTRKEAVSTEPPPQPKPEPPPQPKPEPQPEPGPEPQPERSPQLEPELQQEPEPEADPKPASLASGNTTVGWGDE